jgi:integrase
VPAPRTPSADPPVASIRAYATAKGERRYEVRFRDHSSREHSRVFSVQRDARAFKLDIERRAQAGALYQAAPERFGDVAAAWLERYVVGAAGRVRPRPRSVRVMEDCLGYLAPLNALPVERVRRAVAEDLIAGLAARAPRRAEIALATLKRILRDAEERGQNVDPGVYRLRIAKAQEREPRYLTWAEAEELRSWMPEHVARIVPIAILTMLRRGEILGLRDADLDLEAGSVSVFAQHQDGERVAPKTRAGRRTVDIGPWAVRLLREQQLARLPNGGGYLFPSRAGTPYDGNNFMARIFKPAARAAGIPELTLHDLRHTGASLMIAAGCHVKVIAEQMGHSDGGGLVLKRYGHLYKGARRQAAVTLEAHILGRTGDSAVGQAWDDGQLGLDIDPA